MRIHLGGPATCTHRRAAARPPHQLPHQLPHEPLGHHERSRDGAGGSEAIGGRAVPPMPGTSDTNHSRVSGYSARSSCTAAAARTPPSLRHSGPSRKSPDALQNGGGVRS